MSNNTNFFSDPKIVISIIAIIISLISLIWTLSNQYEQNRRWDKLNAANIVIERAILKRYKSITKEKAMQTNWGYDPNIYGSDFDDQYIIPYKLIAIDKTNEQQITKINSCYTLDEIKNELIRINYKGDIYVLKHFEPKFEIINKGKTVAQINYLKVEAKVDGNNWQEAFSSKNTIELTNDQISTIEIEMNYPISNTIPDIIQFRISIVYIDIHGNKIDKEINTKWISKNNSWAY